MNNEDYMNLVESVSKQVMDKIDFQRGIVQERSDEMREKGCALDVRWKMNVRLILHIHRWHGSCWYCVERNGEQEFLNLMSKYSIPYEYDEANEAYTIYGYKR